MSVPIPRAAFVASSFLLSDANVAAPSIDVDARWSVAFPTRILTQPIVLSENIPSTYNVVSNALRIGSSSSYAATPASPYDPRDAQWEIATSDKVMRQLRLIAGSIVEVTTDTTNSHPCKTVLARIFIGDGSNQSYEGTGIAQSKSIHASSRALMSFGSHGATTQDESGNIVFISPSLQFHLFESEGPISSANASTQVRLRKYFPPVPIHQSAMAEIGPILHTLAPSVLPAIPTAACVVVSRVVSPASNLTASSAFGGNAAKSLASIFLHNGQPRRRVMYAGKDTIIAAPTCLDATAASSWLLRAPPGLTLSGTMQQQQAQGKDETSVAELEESVDVPGHFLPPRSIRLQFFRIVSVNPSYLGQRGMYFSIDPMSTQLVQEGTVQSRVPYALETYLANYGLHLSRINQSPSSSRVAPALQPAFETVRALFLPALSQSSRPSSLPSAMLLSGPRRSHKRKLFSAVAVHLGVHLHEVSLFTLLNESAGETGLVRKLTTVIEESLALAPCILHIRRLGALKLWLQSQQREKDSLTSSALQSLFEQVARQGKPVFIVGSTDSLANVTTSMRNLFPHSLTLEPPGLEQRKAVVRQVLGTTECADESASGATVEKDRNEVQEAAQEVASINAKSIATRSPSPTPQADSISLSPSALASLVATKTAGMNVGELEAFVSHAAKAAVERHMLPSMIEAPSQTMVVKNPATSSSDAESKSNESTPRAMLLASSTPVPSSSSFSSSVSLSSTDIDSALTAHSARSAGQTGTISSVPNVRWADVGGLENVKKEVMEAIELPLRFPHLYTAGVPRRAGLLLYGPPGTGKTMIAKAVATECSLNFMSVKGPELLNMYIGESEKNVRDVFRRAREARPCVIFMDELDALAPNRGSGSDSGGVMDRVSAALLAELDGAAANEGVFVIAATNRPDLIEAGLLRPGRLDRCVYLGVAENTDEQLTILKALTRKFNMPDVKLEDIVQTIVSSKQLGFTLSGADFYALASDALLLAIKRKIDEMDRGLEAARKVHREAALAKRREESKEDMESSDSTDDYIDLTPSAYMSSLPPHQLHPQVSQDDFERALKGLTPSLTATQLKEYKELQARFSQTHAGGKGHAEKSPETETSHRPLDTHSSARPVKKPFVAAMVEEIEEKTSHAVEPVHGHKPNGIHTATSSLAPSKPLAPSATHSLAHVSHTPILEWQRESGHRTRTNGTPGVSSKSTMISSYSEYSENGTTDSTNTATSTAAPLPPSAQAPGRPLKPWERQAAAATNASASSTSIVSNSPLSPPPNSLDVVSSSRPPVRAPRALRTLPVDPIAHADGDASDRSGSQSGRSSVGGTSEEVNKQLAELSIQDKETDHKEGVEHENGTEKHQEVEGTKVETGDGGMHNGNGNGNGHSNGKPSRGRRKQK